MYSGVPVRTVTPPGPRTQTSLPGLRTQMSPPEHRRKTPPTTLVPIVLTQIHDRDDPVRTWNWYWDPSDFDSRCTWSDFNTPVRARSVRNFDSNTLVYTFDPNVDNLNSDFGTPDRTPEPNIRDLGYRNPRLSHESLMTLLGLRPR